MKKMRPMKKLLVTAIVSGHGLMAGNMANAQTGPQFQGSSEAGARSNSRSTSEELLMRNQRTANMTPEELKRDQQLQILEARTGISNGNTSLGRHVGPERHFDKSSGGFMVRKFKAKPGSGEQKRGMSHPIGGSNPKGKPLVHKSKMKKKFFFF
jgi:hypothetical protein